MSIAFSATDKNKNKTCECKMVIELKSTKIIFSKPNIEIITYDIHYYLHR